MSCLAEALFKKTTVIDRKYLKLHRGAGLRYDAFNLRQAQLPGQNDSFDAQRLIEFNRSGINAACQTAEMQVDRELFTGKAHQKI